MSMSKAVRLQLYQSLDVCGLWCDSYVPTRSPNLRACLAIPTETYNIIARWNHRHPHKVLDGDIPTLEIFAERIRELFMRVPTRIATAARTTMTRVAFHVVAVRSNIIWHWNRIPHPTYATTFGNNRVGNLL